MFKPELLLGCVPEEERRPEFRTRPLRLSDYDRGYCQLLKQLTVVGDVDYASFQGKLRTSSQPCVHPSERAARFNEMHSTHMYYVVVVEDESCCKLVASTTLFLEYKFIHANGMVRPGR